MISVSDILRLLDQIPVWKRLAGLPARMEALEARLAALETKPAKAAGPALAPCGICGGSVRVTGERPHVHFGFAGQKTLDVRCDGCGATSDRDWDPKRHG